MIFDEPIASLNSFDSPISSFDDESPKYYTDYEDLIIIEKISEAKFPVYIAISPATTVPYAMKFFPYKNGEPDPYFLNEARFLNLSHPNIIAPLYVQPEKIDEDGNMCSYIVTEYAPYKDFYDAVMKTKIPFDEVLIRTYFHQLIDGLEYLHSLGIAHLDIKLENLLIGENFKLKIIDFDLACHESDPDILSRGTKFYRAPEILKSECKNYFAADVYSAGIILFILKSGGIIPQTENEIYEGCNLYQLLQKNPRAFWKKHKEVQGREDNFWSDEFKHLFVSMTKEDPAQRATISQIKKSKWYKGPTYSDEEVYYIMKNYFEDA